MARYTVVWSSELQDALADLWLNSGSEMRARLTRAAYLVDSELADDPESLGRPAPLESSHRTLDFHLNDSILSATFEVRPDDRTVRVVRIAVRIVQ